MTEADIASTVTPAAAKSRRWRAGLIVMALLVAIPCFALPWLVSTQSGLSALVRLAEALSDGRVAIDRAQGRLIGPLQIGALRLATPTFQLRVSDFAFDWQPDHLHQRRLSVTTLRAATALIATLPSSEPAVMPQSLTLPLAVAIERIEVGSMVVGRLPAAQGRDGYVITPLVELKDLSARLHSDGGAYELSELKLSSAVGEVAAALRLGAERPFPLQASAMLAGERGGSAYRISAKAEGALEAFKLDADASGLNLTGHAVIDATPFASVPFKRVRIEAGEADPAAFRPDLPQAAVTLKADLQPQEENSAALVSPDRWILSGPIQVSNRTPGALDRKLLPVRELKAWAKWSAQRLELTELELALSGTGRLTGQVSYAEGRVEAALDVRDANLAELFTRLKPTRLAGKLQTHATAAEQTIVAELRDPRFSVTLDAGHTEERIDIHSARLQAGGASFDASGRLALAGNHAFNLRGKLVRFDPSLYAAVPRGRLNADLEASGTLKPQPDAGLRFTLRDSQLEGHPLAGRGDLRLLPDRLARSDIALDLDGNRLDAQGAFGRAGDALVLRLDAPRLDVLSAFTPWRLAGQLKGEATLAGTLSEPSGQIVLTANALQLPHALRVASASVRGELREGLDGRFQLQAELAGLRLPDQERVLLQSARVEAEGTRADHRLSSRTVLGGREELELEAEGGLIERMQWNGKLKTFALRGDTPFACSLAAPVALKAGAQGVTLGPAELRGTNARVRLMETSWSPREIVSRGEFTDLALGASMDVEQRIALRGDSLRLGGAWDVRLAEHADGNLRLFRESGDFVLGGDSPVRFGLQEFELRVNAVRDRLAGSINVRGTKIGEIVGSATALAGRGEAGWGLVPDAPLAASVRIAVPSLEWVGPVIDPNLQMGGSFSAEFALTGTPAKPQSQGMIKGDALTIALADQGLRLGEGVLRADFTPDRLRLTDLGFKSASRARPRETRIDVSGLAAEPGHVTAAGEMLLSSGKGEFRFKAERLAVLQRPDRWLMVSGEGRMLTSWEALSVSGRVVADTGYWELSKPETPRLGDDVVILGRQGKAAAGRLRMDLDVEADLGRQFYLKGRGLDTRLSGSVRIRGEGRNALRASGSIRTRDGTYDAYGQFLSIERGIINFQGPIENPGLNVLALRKNLPVEAGVSITGTVQKPRVQLVSEPNVPDSEKLSWIVLGRAPDQVGGGDTRLLIGAANAMLGGESGGISRQLARELGLDEITIGAGDTSGVAGRTPVSTVAGGVTPSAGNTLNSQVLTVGKRLSAAAYLSYEQGLSGADNVVKLTYNLSRRLSLIGRAGTQNAIDLFYTFSFN